MAQYTSRLELLGDPGNIFARLAELGRAGAFGPMLGAVRPVWVRVRHDLRQLVWGTTPDVVSGELHVLAGPGAKAVLFARLDLPGPEDAAVHNALEVVLDRLELAVRDAAFV